MTKLLVRSLLAASAASASLVGCAVDAEPQLGSTAGMSFEEFRAQVPREPGTGAYIVDWDRVIFTDDALRAFWHQFDQGALAIDTQGGVDVKWDATTRHNLTYCISNNFAGNKAAVVTAMQQASDLGWEKFADVNYVYVPGQDANCTAQNTAVMFDVNPVNSGGQYLARSFFPNDGRAVRNVLIDGDSFNPQATGGIPLGNILSHELGHTLGFRHEHIRPEANATQCAEDNNFRGLTTYDSASVMHYPQCNGTSTTLSFTTRDQQGVVSVYGPPVVNMSPMAQVMAPLDGATVGPSFDVTTSVVDTDLVKADLKMDGTLVQSLTSGPFTFHVTGAALGGHVLELAATDGAGQVTTKTINITVTSGGGNGGGGGGGGAGSGDDDGSGQDITGGCSTGGGGASLLLGLGLVGLLIRRKR